MKLLHVPMAVAVLSALVVTAAAAGPKTGVSGVNLNGKMFTLSSSAGGIYFYPPQFYTNPYPTRRYPTRPYYTTIRPYTPESTVSRKYIPSNTTSRNTSELLTTRRPTTTTTSYPRPTATHLPTTTASRIRGWSVCLRYLTDYSTTIFTLGQSMYPLSFGVKTTDPAYFLNMDPFGQSLSFRPILKFLPGIKSEVWSRVCLIVDNMKHVAQVFSGSKTSIRKLLPRQFVWSGEPVINFSEFNGQLTDVQMWDHTLSKLDVLNYMTCGTISGPYSGSLITWSYISYSSSGITLLEDDAYEWQARQPISSRRRSSGGLKKRVKRILNMMESNPVWEKYLLK
ncbi:hypothetical protein PBY51_012689 [Eleginops maclovinus]|uniref:Pentraxin (PTX) domain-containing protein n=1 Tax=Eleginops maclovinus TaxID=56733 RepID=A0AAN7Y3I0_ELEMC|nr:hypothetical protein PBY51_012689 [Eleginops maclovinus]